MTTFLDVSLVTFAACAALGIVPVAVLAAKERKPAVVVVALFVAAFVIYVLVVAAIEVHRGR